MLLFGFWLLCGFFAAIVASSKGHSGWSWFFGGVLFGPLALIASIGVARDQAAIEQKAADAGELRKCPACAEFIKAEAVKCRYCGSDIEPLPPILADESPPSYAPLNAAAWVIVAAAVAVGIFAWLSIDRDPRLAPDAATTAAEPGRNH